MSTVQKSKSRLGRGLSSLLSVADLPVEAEVPPLELPNTVLGDAGNTGNAVAASDTRPASAPTEIAVDRISPNPHQPRRQINDESIAALAASIKSTGLIQPVIVRRTPGTGENDSYQLIAGERRWRAAKLAGLAAIPAIVREVDSFTQAQMALIENIQREDLNPIDRAESYRSLMTQLGLTQAELANRLGEDRSSIANFVRLLDLAEPVRAMLRDGRLSLGHAKILAGVPDVLEQDRLANLVVAQELSVRNLERLLQSHDGQTSARQSPDTAATAPSAHIADLEKSIARQLGMRVQVRSGKKGKGKLVIHYASLDQFDDLIGRLGVSVE
jgi:ParB family chromosome partitioning protein